MIPIKKTDLSKIIRNCIAETSFYLTNVVGHFSVINMLNAGIDKTLVKEKDEHIVEVISDFIEKAPYYCDVDIENTDSRTFHDYFVENSPTFPIEFFFQSIRDFVFENTVDLAGFEKTSRDKRTWQQIMRMRINIAEQFIKSASVNWIPNATWQSPFNPYLSEISRITEMVEIANARLKYHEDQLLTIQNVSKATDLKEQTIRNIASKKDYLFSLTKSGSDVYVDMDVSRSWFESRDEFKQPTIIDNFKPLALKALDIIETYDGQSKEPRDEQLNYEYNSDDVDFKTAIKESRQSLINEGLGYRDYIIYAGLNYLKTKQFENYDYLKWCVETMQTYYRF